MGLSPDDSAHHSRRAPGAVPLNAISPEPSSSLALDSLTAAKDAVPHAKLLEAVALPETLRDLLTHARTLTARLGIPAEAAASIASALEAKILTNPGTDPAEATLFAALVKASPEIAAFAERLASARIPGVPVPLHPAAFALIGALYFHARLVSYDPALASQTADAYTEGTQKDSFELAQRFREFLLELAREPHSVLGILATREVGDSNSGCDLHVLGGLLSPAFAEMTRGDPGVRGMWLTRILDGIPPNLTDLGLLEKIQFGHSKLVQDLASVRSAAEAQEQIAREEKAAQEREAEENRQTIERTKAYRLEARERVAAGFRKIEDDLKALFESLLDIPKAGGRRPLSDQDKQALLATCVDRIAAVSEINDRTLYLILDKLPRGIVYSGAPGLFGGVAAINAIKQREGRTTWKENTLDNSALGLLWVALSKVSFLEDPRRFGRLPGELLGFIDDHQAKSVDTGYKSEFLDDLRRVVLSLHASRLQSLADS